MINRVACPRLCVDMVGTPECPPTPVLSRDRPPGRLSPPCPRKAVDMPPEAPERTRRRGISWPTAGTAGHYTMRGPEPPGVPEMPQTDLRAALDYLSARPAPDGGRTDRQLLDRFAADRDESAFAALVRRHAALVLAACRRVLRNAADAEDAFQATFLVLARKPRAVRSAESVGPWLYTVALRQAARLKADALRRKDRERASASRPVAATPEPTLREVESVLDEELGSLPARLRSPLVLCYLEARTRDEAARELGWSVRTLQRRLDEGRRKLHARLLRRGVSLPAALLTLGLVQPEASAVRAACACATSRGTSGPEIGRA